MNPTNYTEADHLFQTVNRRSEYVKLAGNTLLHKLEDGNTIDATTAPDRFIVTLHGHRIVTFYKDGSLVLDSCGWRTVTTKERINRYLPPGLSLYQEKHEWWIADNRPEFMPEGMERFDKRLRARFEDRMEIRPDSSLHGLDRQPECGTCGDSFTVTTDEGQEQSCDECQTIANLG